MAAMRQKPSLQYKWVVPESGHTATMTSYRHRSPGVRM